MHKKLLTVLVSLALTTPLWAAPPTGTSDIAGSTMATAATAPTSILKQPEAGSKSGKGVKFSGIPKPKAAPALITAPEMPPVVIDNNPTAYLKQLASDAIAENNNQIAAKRATAGRRPLDAERLNGEADALEAANANYQAIVEGKGSLYIESELIQNKLRSLMQGKATGWQELSSEEALALHETLQHFSTLNTTLPGAGKDLDALNNVLESYELNEPGSLNTQTLLEKAGIASTPAAAESAAAGGEASPVVSTSLEDSVEKRLAQNQLLANFLKQQKTLSDTLSKIVEVPNKGSISVIDAMNNYDAIQQVLKLDPSSDAFATEFNALKVQLNLPNIVTLGNATTTLEGLESSYQQALKPFAVNGSLKELSDKVAAFDGNNLQIEKYPVEDINTVKNLLAIDAFNQSILKNTTDLNKLGAYAVTSKNTALNNAKSTFNDILATTQDANQALTALGPDASLVQVATAEKQLARIQAIRDSLSSFKADLAELQDQKASQSTLSKLVDWFKATVLQKLPGIRNWAAVSSPTLNQQIDSLTTELSTGPAVTTVADDLSADEITAFNTTLENKQESIVQESTDLSFNPTVSSDGSVPALNKNEVDFNNLVQYSEALSELPPLPDNATVAQLKIAQFQLKTADQAWQEVIQARAQLTSTVDPAEQAKIIVQLQADSAWSKSVMGLADVTSDVAAFDNFLSSPAGQDVKSMYTELVQQQALFKSNPALGDIDWSEYSSLSEKVSTFVESADIDDEVISPLVKIVVSADAYTNEALSKWVAKASPDDIKSTIASMQADSSEAFSSSVKNTIVNALATRVLSTVGAAQSSGEAWAQFASDNDLTPALKDDLGKAMLASPDISPEDTNSLIAQMRLIEPVTIPSTKVPSSSTFEPGAPVKTAKMPANSSAATSGSSKPEGLATSGDSDSGVPSSSSASVTKSSPPRAKAPVGATWNPITQTYEQTIAPIQGPDAVQLPPDGTTVTIPAMPAQPESPVTPIPGEHNHGSTIDHESDDEDIFHFEP